MTQRLKGRLLLSPSLDVFGQMALDDALARGRPDGFTIRFYRWAGAGATFGYAQRLAEVRQVLPPELGDRVTRRPTGGGVVLHVDDLTFSCVYPAQGVLRAADHYRRLHAAIWSGLCAMGVEARLCAPDVSVPPPMPGVASQCFSEPVPMDLLADGEKILGGALRRRGDTLLYQGSLQRPDARRRAAEYQEAILRGIAAEWDLTWEDAEPMDGTRAAARTLEATYRSPEWIGRR